MKKAIILAALLLSSGATAALAQQGAYDQRPGLMITDEAPPVSPMMQKIAYLQGEWARIKYQVKGDDAQEKAFQKLDAEAAEISKTFPDKAEPKIWQAIILSTEAGVVGGLGALPKVKQAKKLLEAALKIDSNALEGSASTSLGSLYYQVPGWPIGFGDDKKAEQYLKSALSINPDGIDPNFFYGDYLVDQKRYSEALPVLEKALKAPDRPGRKVADEGRRGEIRALLAKARKKAGMPEEAKADYN